MSRDMTIEICNIFVQAAKELLRVDVDETPLLQWIFDHVDISGNKPTIRDIDSILTSNELTQALIQEVLTPATKWGNITCRTVLMFRQYLVVSQWIFREHPKVKTGMAQAIRGMAVAHRIALNPNSTPSQLSSAEATLTCDVAPFIITQLRPKIDMVLKKTHECLLLWVMSL